MLSILSNRLLPLLQFTRFALVFTAIADGWCGLLLLSALPRADGSYRPLDGVTMLLVAGISVGLYAFGMTLNDLIDRRRDVAIAAHRPLPSGRIPIATAQVICASLLVLAALCGMAYARRSDGGLLSLVLVIFTAMLIGFYDLAGKYLVAPGLITLGLIRFFHAVIAVPQMPVLWHPLLLLNHVAIVSMLAYRWEEKRPALSRRQGWLVLGGLLLLNAMVVVLIVLRRLERGTIEQILRLQPGLILPAGAVVAFVVTVVLIRRRAKTSREAGQRLMLTGLLWLIVYDAAFVAGYVSIGWAAILALLLPVAYLSVLTMRWWSTIVALSHRPAFKRAE